MHRNSSARAAALARRGAIARAGALAGLRKPGAPARALHDPHRLAKANLTEGEVLLEFERGLPTRCWVVIHSSISNTIIRLGETRCRSPPIGGPNFFFFFFVTLHSWDTRLTLLLVNSILI